VKVGDLVRSVPHGILTQSGRVGIVVDTIQKKVWRTDVRGKRVNWDKVEPEPHAVVLFSHNDGPINIPWSELEVVDAYKIS
jgi:predicted oxidoreductase (fatty acid repression mutant protein)